MISPDQVQAVADWLKSNAANTRREQALRAAFPDLHFTFCSDDDVMVDDPALGVPGFNLYFVDSSSHCLSLTADPTAASGLVVAEIEQD